MLCGTKYFGFRIVDVGLEQLNLEQSYARQNAAFNLKHFNPLIPGQGFVQAILMCVIQHKKLVF